jgi:hypothetical protein
MQHSRPLAAGVTTELFQNLLLALKNVGLVVKGVTLQAAKASFPFFPGSKLLFTCNFTPTLRADIALPELKQILFFRFVHGP